MNAMERRTELTRALLLIAYVAFISLGLPDTLIGVAWPSVRETFQVNQRSAGLIFIASGCGYFVSGFFTGRILHFVRIGLLLAASSALVALSGFGFALANIWPLFVGCAILHGLGSGAIDGGLNNYAATHFSAKQMNWLHACYSIGATFGPLIMTLFIAQSGSWRAGYAMVAMVMLMLALLFFSTRAQWTAPQETADTSAQNRSTPINTALAEPLVWLQTALFFVYTGFEISVGQWSFTLLTESRHIDVKTAGVWVTMYWGSIGAGRIFFGLVVERIGIDRLIRASTFTALLGAVIVVTMRSPLVTVAALVLIGLALAPIYPSMMTRTPQRLGAATAVHAIGFQVAAAMLGAAVLPSLTGLLAELKGLESISFTAAAMATALLLLHEALLRRPHVRTESAS